MQNERICALKRVYILYLDQILQKMCELIWNKESTKIKKQCTNMTHSEKCIQHDYRYWHGERDTSQ
jgi:hypothetical protein